MNRETNPNPWDLYTSEPGWQRCSIRLDRALADALDTLDARVTDGHNIISAAHMACVQMMGMMREDDNQRYGAFDSEPLHRMERLICAHVRARYGMEVSL